MEDLTEDPIKKLIVDSPDSDIFKQKWIPFKGQNIYIQVGKHSTSLRLNLLFLNDRGMLLFDGTSIIKGEQLISRISCLCYVRERGLNKPQHFLQVKYRQSNLSRLL